MAMVLREIKYCYKMSNFHASGISYLTYCVTNQGLLMQLAWIFLKIYKYYFLQGNLRKTMKKNFSKTTTIFC